EVAGRVEAVFLCQLPDSRTHPDRERERREARQPAPPPRLQPPPQRQRPHAFGPSLYRRPATLTVAPAPMFAASIDARTRPGPSLRPATKNALLVRTNRAVHRPRPTTAQE